MLIRTLTCSASASPVGIAVGRRPDGSHASALYGLPHGALCSSEGTGERRPQEASLMLDHYARMAAQDHLDAAQKVDATARTVDVPHPNGDALDGARILPELLAEPSPDVCAIILVEPDAVDSDVRGCQRCRRPTTGPLDGPGHLIRQRFSLSSSHADAFA